MYIMKMKLVSAYVGGEGKRSGLRSKKYLLYEKKIWKAENFFSNMVTKK